MKQAAKSAALQVASLDSGATASPLFLMLPEAVERLGFLKLPSIALDSEDQVDLTLPLVIDVGDTGKNGRSMRKSKLL